MELPDMELAGFKMQGEADAVFGFMNILATTSKKEYESSPHWWSLRGKILALDMGRDPRLGLGNRLVDRRN